MAYQEVKVKQPLLLTILPILSLATFFFGWQALVSWNIIPNELLASPIQVFHTFLDKLHDPMPDGAVLSTHIWTSLKEAFIGYGLSLLVGIPLGLAIQASCDMLSASARNRCSESSIPPGKI